MNFEKLLPFNGWAAIVSGLARLLAAAVIFASILISGIPELVVVSLLLIANIFLVFALMGIYGSQIETMGEYGFLGFVLAEIGILLNLADFFPPSDDLFFLIGLSILVTKNERSAILPKWGMWLWLAGSAIIVTGAYFGILLVVVLGLLLAGFGLILVGRGLLHLQQD